MFNLKFHFTEAQNDDIHQGIFFCNALFNKKNKKIQYRLVFYEYIRYPAE